MKNWMLKDKRLLTLLGVLVAVIVVGLSLPDVKKEQVDITLKQMDFKPFKTQYAITKKDVLKKPYMLVEFFTFSCPHCKASIPELNKLNKRDDISVVAYIMANSSKVKEYAKMNDVKYTISRATPYYMDKFEPVAVPMSFILDTKTLEVKEKIIGRITKDKVEKLLENI